MATALYTRCGVCRGKLPIAALPADVCLSECRNCAVHKACVGRRCECGSLVVWNPAPANACVGENCGVPLPYPGLCERCTAATAERFLRRLTVASTLPTLSAVTTAVRSEIFATVAGVALDRLTESILPECTRHWQIAPTPDNGVQHFTSALSEQLDMSPVSLDQFWHEVGVPLTGGKGKDMFVAHCYSSPRVEVLPQRMLRAASSFGVYNNETLLEYVHRKGSTTTAVSELVQECVCPRSLAAAKKC